MFSTSKLVWAVSPHGKSIFRQQQRGGNGAAAFSVAAAAAAAAERSSSGSRNSSKRMVAIGASIAGMTAALATTTANDNHNNNHNIDTKRIEATFCWNTLLWKTTTTICESGPPPGAIVTQGRVPLGTGLLESGPLQKEAATGILFPQLINGMTLVGTGVRIKYVFAKVYAVGTYMDPVAMAAIKSRPKEEIERALLNPTYPRVIRIVLHRNLTSQQFTDAVVDALEPRMHNQDMWALTEFRKFNDYNGKLVEGSQVCMTIRGDTLLYESPNGAFGQIRSEVFTKAMCDIYYGSDPVSPTHKKAVVDGIPKNM